MKQGEREGWGGQGGGRGVTDLPQLEGGPLHHNPDGQPPPAPVMPGHIVAAQQEEEVREEGHTPPPTQVPAAPPPPWLQVFGP